MPQGDGKKGPSAGISSTDEVNVAALFARLQEEVRGRPPSPRRPGGSLDRLAVRSTAERLWPVTFDRPLERRAGLRGAALKPVKRALRPLMRWYVEPFAYEQRNFNDAALKLIDALSERVDEAHGAATSVRSQVDELAGRIEAAERTVAGGERLVAELEERLLRLERRERGSAPAAPATVASQPGAAALPDYFAFEARMRALPEEIRRRQEIYVDDFRDAAPVLDVGCGRGEFLALLREAGIEARGVDADADMVAYARGERLEVEQDDALRYLERVDDGALGGIFAAQVVEHLPAPALLRLLQLAAGKLRPGGLLVAETINPLAPMAFRHYFADLTHSQPLVPETLALLVRHAGFPEVEIRYVNEPTAEERLRPVELPPGPEFDEARAALAANVRLLNDHLFGPLDYAILARA
jgi:SAM-dependent methyltransferase